MLLPIHPDNPDTRKIAQVVECLRKGGIVVYPTDTVYSMGCDMYNSKALEKLALIKQIKLEKANFSLVCHDLSNLTEYSKQLSNPVHTHSSWRLVKPFQKYFQIEKRQWAFVFPIIPLPEPSLRPWETLLFQLRCTTTIPFSIIRPMQN